MLAAMGHPNPSVRKEVIMCVVRYFQQTKVLPDRAIMKPIVEAGMKAMDDQDKDVRETASELLGTVMKLFGERSMLNYMEQLDKIKQEKVKAVFDKVTVNVKVKPAPAAAPAKKASASGKAVMREASDDAPPPARSAAPSLNKENDPPKTAPARAPQKAAAATASSSSASAKSKMAPSSSSSSMAPAAKKAAGVSNDDVPPFTMSEEESKARAEEVIPAELREKLENANWKQVQSKTFDAIAVLASRSPKFNRACAAAVVPGLIEKTSDAKIKPSCYECFTTFAEKLGLQFVFSQRMTSTPLLRVCLTPVATFSLFLFSSVPEPAATEEPQGPH